jgi:hypothetical protein
MVDAGTPITVMMTAATAVYIQSASGDAQRAPAHHNATVHAEANVPGPG